MFGEVSPRYDLLNRLLSLGLDQGWRRQALAQLSLPTGGRLLDVATGTGDMALLALRLFPGCQVVGIDVSESMLALGQQKIGLGRCRFLLARAQELPFADNTFAGVTCAFGVRNFSPVLSCIQEMGRVTQPGGRVVILELTRPSFPLLRFFHALYLRSAVPLLGALFRRAGAYRYLATSILAFPAPQEFLPVLAEAGLERPRHIPLSGGIVGVFLGEKK
jgi:demethylmenaquinone methyltransferase/2-methoxy-6-polyprenyl-1,4-benzoquinol methylase